MKYLVLILLTLATSESFAEGKITIAGHVNGFDSNQVVIQSDRRLYYIDRSKVPKVQQSLLKNIKANQQISLTVPFSGITKAKHEIQK